ncbi:MAG: DNA mismatch repair protein MutL, partial [Haloarculaceae archaeon]
EVPADEVDVNVHPRKMEVRFGESERVKETVEAAVEAALLEAGMIRTSAPRGRSRPDEAAIAPGRRWDADDADGPDEDASWHEREMDSNATGTEATDDGTQTGDDADDAPEPNHPDDTDTHEETTTEPTASTPTTDEEVETGWSAPESHGASDDRRAVQAHSDADVTEGDGTDADERRFRAPTENARLGAAGDEATPREAFERLPSLRVLGQLHDTYLVASSPEGLVLIDQHAADERINYERLREAVAEGTTSQTLVSPVALELTAAEAAVFDDALPALRELGFEASLDGREATVTAVPAVFDDALDPDVLRDALAAFLEADGDHGETVAEVRDDLLADLACYPSITGNTSLREGDVVALLAELDDCENPWACPHGRPVVVRIDEAELDERFERDYPGHQVRRPE